MPQTVPDTQLVLDPEKLDAVISQLEDRLRALRSIKRAMAKLFESNGEATGAPTSKPSTAEPIK